MTTAFGPSHHFLYGISIQPDGKIIAAGSSYNGTDHDIALTRYNADGTLDADFDEDGKVTTDFGGANNSASSVLIQPDGRIVIAGSSHNGTDYDFALVRYNMDGTLDSAFGEDGRVMTDISGERDIANAIALQPDGKIVVAGTAFNGLKNDFALTRYNENGTLDATFGASGKVITAFGTINDDVRGVSIQRDGKIIIAGSSNNGTVPVFALARYNSDGTLDMSFGTDGKVTTVIDEYNEGYCVSIDGYGRIIAAGMSFNGTDYDFALARYNP